MYVPPSLLCFVNNDGPAIHPPHHLSSLLSPSSPPLEDLSISRPSTRLHWGIRVPGDATQTIYVWVDALVGYLTGVGFFPERTREGGERCAWPPDVQVIGKDIVR